MEEKKNGNKKMIIIAAAAVAVLAAVLAVIFFVTRNKDTYRVLKVYKIEGTANVIHPDGTEITPYESMLLQSGDRISLDSGYFVIKADEDKYIYLEDDTEILLQADGTQADSHTRIELVKGAIINHIEKPLSDGSVYEVNTQNATMSVRGTIFRVNVTVSSNGGVYTDVQVFETDLIMPDKTPGGRRVTVSIGKQIRIFMDTTITDYVGDPDDIDYEKLAEQTIEYLGIVSDNTDRKMSISVGNLSGDEGGTVTVRFMYNGSVFGETTVDKGERVDEPLLMPTEKGHWEFSFDKKITKDTDIDWVAE